MAEEPNSEKSKSLNDQYYEVVSLPGFRADAENFGHITERRGSKILLLQKGSARRVLEQRGLTFPDGASATTEGFPFAGIYMRNTKQNHEKLQKLLDSIGAGWEIRSSENDGANKPEQPSPTRDESKDTV